MISGNDFLMLAERWIQGGVEAEWRSAVSRAYYAAFHQARVLLRELGFQPPQGDQAHAYLWLRLSNSGDAEVQLAGSDLSSLRRDRNRADYELERTLTHADALQQIQAARLIFQTLEDARSEPVRTQIAASIRAYERDILRQVTWRA